MENEKAKVSKNWLQKLANGGGSPVDVLTSASLKVVHAEKGLIRCRFIISDRLTDGDGNWHVGAMATLIDNIAGATVHSFAGQIKPTLNFSMSFYSTAKSQEEVEIEARAAKEKGKLSAVIIEIIKKDSGELIAVGKQWTAPITNNADRASEFWVTINNNPNPSSKL